MNEKSLQDLDLTFEQRALRLVEDAKADAMANSHGAQAIRGYLYTANFKEKAGLLAAKIGVNMGKALAAAAITAAGVSCAAVTFGIGPVIGLVLGKAVDAMAGEAKYQLQTKALRQGIDYTKWGDSISDPALLEPGMAKVLRKLERVLTRHAQLQGGAGGFFSKVKSAGTAIRAWRAGELHWSQGFPHYAKPNNPATHDTEINQRLFELNYYVQMLGNFATEILGGMIGERDRYVDYADLVYGHVVRQVHYTGNHEACDAMCCYSMPTVEFNARLNQIASMHRADPGVAVSTALGSGQVDMAMARYTARHKAVPVLENTEILLRNLQLALGEVPPPVEEESIGQMVTGFFKKTAKPTGDEADAARFSPALSAALSVAKGPAMEAAGQGFVQRTGGKETVQGVAITDTTRGVITGQAAAAQAGISAIAEGFGLFEGEVTSAAKNILLKRAVLKKRDRAFNLLNAQMASREEAAQALKDIAKGKDIMSRSARVAQKIAWYINKIERIESELKTKHLPGLLRNRDFEFSSFATCRDAWNVSRSVHYLFKQYEKAITFLVYLEVILVELDAKVAKELQMPTGSIYDPGMPTPARPRHMTAVERTGPLLDVVPTLDVPPPPPPDPFDDDLL
jgi:hypothetical protein